MPNNAPPLLGAHNEEILCSIGGIGRDELELMKKDGVI